MPPSQKEDMAIVQEIENLREQIKELKNVSKQQKKEAIGSIHESNLIEKALFDSSEDFVILLTPDAELVDINDTAAKHLKVTRTELIGKCIWDYTPPHVLNERKQRFDYVKKNKVMLRGEEQGVSGQWLDTMVVPLLDGNQRLQHIVILSRNIDRYKQTENTILREKERLQQLLDIAGVLFLVLNTQGKIILINKKGIEILGYQNESDLLDKNWFKTCLPPDQQKSVFRVFQQLVAGEIAPFEYYENYVIRPDGNKRLLSFRNTLLFDETGKCAGTLSSGEDITLTRNAELLEAEHVKQLSFLSEAAMAFVELPHDGDVYQTIADLLARAIQDWSFICVSSYNDNLKTYQPKAIKGIEKHVGFIQRILGKHPLEFHSILSKEASQAIIKGTIQKLSGGLEQIAPDILSSTITSSIARFLDLGNVYLIGFVKGGKIYGCVTLICKRRARALNISLINAFTRQAIVALERRQYEERLKNTEIQLFHSQKLEAIGRLAGGIAHDFNNILAVIVTVASVLAQEMSAENPQQTQIQEILTASKRGSSLVNNLLHFSRKEKGHQQWIDTSMLIEEVKHILERTISKQIKINIEVDLGLPKLSIDPLHLQQILINLAINSADAIVSQGEISIRANRQCFSEEEATSIGLDTKSYLLIQVEDNGCGMSSEIQCRAFEPFFTTKAPQNGAGFGLAITFGLVEGMGGRIFLKSNPEQGTTATIYLPWIEKQHSLEKDLDESDDMPNPNIGFTGRILVVDDEPALRHAMKRILTRLGYDVITAADAHEAIAFCQKEGQTFQVILLDVEMPNMDGLECLQKLRAIAPASKVILCTGHLTEIDNTSLEKMGAAGLINKPFEFSELSKTITRVMNGGR